MIELTSWNTDTNIVDDLPNVFKVMYDISDFIPYGKDIYHEHLLNVEKLLQACVGKYNIAHITHTYDDVHEWHFDKIG